MIECTLLYPDQVSWWGEPGYSAEASDDLTDAYQFIYRGDGYTFALPAAAVLVERWLGKYISAHQRMHVYYVFALAHAADDNTALSLFWVDKALGHASRLHEIGDQAELLIQRASLHRSTLEFEEAAEDLKLCLMMLDEQRQLLGIETADAQLRIYPQLATYEFYLARFQSAEALIAQARSLLSSVKSPQPLSMGTLEWNQAKLYNLKGQSYRALWHILSIAGDYARVAPAISRERFEIDVADYALNWAQSIPAGDDRADFIRLAARHLSTADGIATELRDAPGAGLIQLKQVHLSRLTNGLMDRVGALEAVIRQGRTLGDEALIAQGLIALGDELTYRDEHESARNCYRQTLGALDGSQVPALAIPARRALHMADEQNPPTGWNPLADM